MASDGAALSAERSSRIHALIAARCATRRGAPLETVNPRTREPSRWTISTGLAAAAAASRCAEHGARVKSEASRGALSTCAAAP
eukprot:6038364-Prymnesium_polylepis.1